MKLLKEAIVKLFAGAVLMSLLLFLPAGTVHYPGGLRLMMVLFVPMLCGGLVMWKKAPGLLAKRLQAKETQSAQQTVIKLSGLMFLTGFVLAGSDHRFGWTQVSGWIVWLFTGVFLLGYGILGEVLRENAYLSRTVEVRPEQTVIDTGLYGVVRHPMYSATLLMFLSMPLVLGSLAAFPIFLVYLPIIRVRILNEESVLREGLTGYSEYCARVRYRLIPCIW